MNFQDVLMFARYKLPRWTGYVRTYRDCYGSTKYENEWIAPPFKTSETIVSTVITEVVRPIAAGGTSITLAQRLASLEKPNSTGSCNRLCPNTKFMTVPANILDMHQ